MHYRKIGAFDLGTFYYQLTWDVLIWRRFTNYIFRVVSLGRLQNYDRSGIKAI